MPADPTPSVEPLTLYVIEADGRHRRAPVDVPASAWLAMVTPDDRVVFARPGMADLGHALGRAGLLGRREVSDELRRLRCPPAYVGPTAPPPVWVAARLLANVG